MNALAGLFSLEGRVAVVTGGTGTLGTAAVAGLAGAGATVVVIGRNGERARAVVDEAAPRGLALVADVLDAESLAAARDTVTAELGRVDILVNLAGGNLAAATLEPGGSFFDISAAALADVVDLNLMGTVLPIRAFGPAMAGDAAGAGGASIVNVVSVAADRPLSRVAGYSAAKAAVLNLTRWLAAELGRSHAGRVRVNALMPGFIVAGQNRALLLDGDGAPTERGRRVLAHTPLGRFGTPSELVGALVWLCGPSAGFVTGSVVTVDGGFTADAGV